jgi:hypothetical protein
MAMEKPTVDGTKECTGETDFNTKSQFHQGQLDPFLAPISKEAKERTIAKENPTADLIAPNRSRLEPMIARIKESRGRKMAMGNPTAELIARKSKSEAITRLADEFIKEYDELRVPMLKAAQFLAGKLHSFLKRLETNYGLSFLDSPQRKQLRKLTATDDFRGIKFGFEQ